MKYILTILLGCLIYSAQGQGYYTPQNQRYPLLTDDWKTTGCFALPSKLEDERDPRITALERQLFPNKGTCLRCRRPWNCCHPYAVYYDESNGAFPLCSDCWNDCTIAQRKKYFRTLYFEWRADGVPRPKDTVGLYEKLMDAVDRESGKPSQWQQQQMLQDRLDSLTHALQTIHDSLIMFERLGPKMFQWEQIEPGRFILDSVLLRHVDTCVGSTDSTAFLRIGTLADTTLFSPAPKKKRRKG